MNYEIVDNMALKLEVPPDALLKITSQIEKSEALSSNEVLVYWGQQELEQLTSILDDYFPSMQIARPPSPILRDYTWPGIYTPFEHQKTTSAFLSARPRAHCFNEQGTAKTGSAIWAADYLMNEGFVNRVLVVCPISIMYTAWQADIFRTAMHRSVGIAYGDRLKRKKVLDANYDFTIINYDGLISVHEEIKAAGFNLIIVDEASHVKNPQTNRWKALAKLVTPTTRLWLMTGTPAAQSPVDAYGLAKLVAPHRVPKFMTGWKYQVMTQRSRFRWEPKPTAKGDVYAALQPAIRFTKKECLDLPELLYQTRDVPLSPQAAAYYKKLKTELLIETVGEEISAVNAAAAMLSLIHI